MNRNLLLVGASMAFLGVALGAFGSHGLRERVDPSMLVVWQTAVHYHLFHALAIVVMSSFATRLPKAKTAGTLFFLGIVVFAGTLYAYVVTGIRSLAMLTPIGGVLFLLGWLWLVVSAWSIRDENYPQD